MDEFDAMFGLDPPVSEPPQEMPAEAPQLTPIQHTANKLYEIFAALVTAGFTGGTALYMCNNLLIKELFG